jgi:hypothetical protein
MQVYGLKVKDKEFGKFSSWQNKKTLNDTLYKVIFTGIYKTGFTLQSGKRFQKPGGFLTTGGDKSSTDSR